MKRGFTLIELLVVIGMIAVLTGAASSSVMRARKRSQIARAETEAREITNAILAYENYDEDHSLKTYATGKSWVKAKKDNLKFILGEVEVRGNKVPVLFNASIVHGGELRDPWGTPYEFMIAEAGDAVKKSGDKVGKSLHTFLYLPNLYWRRGE